MGKKKKWGKIGAPKSKKRKAWLAGLRKRKEEGTTRGTKKRRKRKASSPSPGRNYETNWGAGMHDYVFGNPDVTHVTDERTTRKYVLYNNKWYLDRTKKKTEKTTRHPW